MRIFFPLVILWRGKILEHSWFQVFFPFLFSSEVLFRVKSVFLKLVKSNIFPYWFTQGNIICEDYLMFYRFAYADWFFELRQPLSSMFDSWRLRHFSVSISSAVREIWILVCISCRSFAKFLYEFYGFEIKYESSLFVFRFIFRSHRSSTSSFAGNTRVRQFCKDGFSEHSTP